VRDERYAFQRGLRDKHAIERVVVMTWQRRSGLCVFERDREPAKSAVIDTALTNTIDAVAIASRAAVFSRGSFVLHQMKT
jgi:hypothetical protein